MDSISLKYQNIPQILKKLNIWLCYDDRDKEKYKDLSDDEINQEKKRPRDLRGIKCSLERCYSFNACIESIKNGFNSGLGFACKNNGIIAIDYDKCIKDYEINDDLGYKKPIFTDTESEQRILRDINLIDSYTEISPSGKGIHIYLIANKNIKININRPNIEIYTNHFIRVSGNLFNEYLYQDISDKTSEIEQLLNNYNIVLKDDEIGNKSIIKQRYNLYDYLLEQKFKYANGYTIPQIKKSMFDSKKGKLLKKLYDNTITDAEFYKLKGKSKASDDVKAKIDTSDSGKAITLIMHLLHFSYGDKDKVYKLFLSSNLCKDKYTKKSYANHKEDIIQNQFIPKAIVYYINYDE